MENDQDQNAVTSAVNVESAQGGGTWDAIIKMFTAPTRAAQILKEKPKILIPLIITFVLSAVVVIATMKYSMNMQVDMIAKARNLPPEIVDQIRAGSAQLSLVKNLIGAVVGSCFVLLFTLISAGLAMFLGSVLMGGKAGFKAVLSVTAVAGLISALGSIITLPLMFLKGTLLVSIGFAGLLPGKDFTSLLYSFLYQYNFFMIWSVIAAGIGYAVIYEFPRNKGLNVAIISSLIMAVLAIAFRLVGLIMAGVEITLL